MKNHLRSIGAVALLGLGAQAALAGSPPVGLTVYAKEWHPTKPDGEALKMIENNPAVISDTLDTAWRVFRQCKGSPWFSRAVTCKEGSALTSCRIWPSACRTLSISATLRDTSALKPA